VLSCVPDVKDYRQCGAGQAPFSDSGETRLAAECFSSSIPRRGPEIAESFRLLGQDVARRVDVRQREKRTRCHVENTDKSPKEIICVEVPACI
jgi:hypothetical protein